MLVKKGTLHAGVPASFTTIKERDASVWRAVRCTSGI
jgi:hypothetical protein